MTQTVRDHMRCQKVYTSVTDLPISLSYDFGQDIIVHEEPEEIDRLFSAVRDLSRPSSPDCEWWYMGRR